MKAKDAKKFYDVSYVTLREWAKSGKIPVEILPSGRINYLPSKSSKSRDSTKTVIYSRVSTSIQKENLHRQTERLKLFCASRGLIVDEVYEEIGSALNYNRKLYIKLLHLILNKEIKTIVVEYKDRLLRVGFEEFKYICDHNNVELIVVDNSETTKLYTHEITEDLMSIIHHYSMRSYSSRKRKKLEEVLNDNDQA
jgi:putative resolvase